MRMRTRWMVEIVWACHLFGSDAGRIGFVLWGLWMRDVKRGGFDQASQRRDSRLYQGSYLPQQFNVRRRRIVHTPNTHDRAPPSCERVPSRDERRRSARLAPKRAFFSYRASRTRACHSGADECEAVAGEVPLSLPFFGRNFVPHHPPISWPTRILRTLGTCTAVTRPSRGEELSQTVKPIFPGKLP